MIISKDMHKVLFQKFTPLVKNTKNGLNRFCHGNIQVLAYPQVALADTVPRIVVNGLKPGSPISLMSEMKDSGNKCFTSKAHFIADVSGSVNLLHSTSVGGSYKGIFPTGLISTLKTADGSYLRGRTMKIKITEPTQINVRVYDGHLQAHCEKSLLGNVVLERHYMSPGVTRIPVRDGRIRGSLFLPKGEGPFPAIIDLNGAGGKPSEVRSALNASRGIASLTLAYFNYDDIPINKLFDLDLEYFEEAMEYILSQPGVIPDRCGVLGNCEGGFIANLMGVHFGKIKAVMSINAPFNSGIANISFKNRLLEKGLILTAHHFTKLREDSEETIPTDELRHYFSDLEKSYVNQLPSVEKETFFSFDVAEEDTYFYRDGLRKFMKKLNEIEKRNISCTIYPNAGHIIDAPFSPTLKAAYVPLWSDQKLGPDNQHPAVVKFWGGQEVGDVHMQERIWKKSFVFFNMHVKNESRWYQNWLINQFEISDENKRALF